MNSGNRTTKPEKLAKTASTMPLRELEKFGEAGDLTKERPRGWIVPAVPNGVRP
jgi:hypothetical protein